MVNARKNVKQLSNLCQYHSQGLHYRFESCPDYKNKKYGKEI